jgi:hypothetical protein
MHQCSNWKALFSTRSVRLVRDATQEELLREIITRVEAGSNTSTVTLRVVRGDEKGSLESETVKYGHESYGTRTQKWLRWRVPVAIANGRPVLSSERAPQINKPATVSTPNGSFVPRQTGRLTVGRNITLTLTVERGIFCAVRAEAL